MHRIVFVVGASVLALSIFFHVAHAVPFYPSPYSQTRHKDYLVEVEDPDAVLEMLAKLGQSILRAQHEGSNAKRGLDLGLGRGFSGSQAAKHLMGLAAANFAAGPGKRKRGDGVVMEMPWGTDPQQSFVAPTSNENDWSNNGISTAKD